MVFHENHLLVLMKYNALFFRKSEKISQNLSSAAVVIGAFRPFKNMCIVFTINIRTDLCLIRVYTVCHSITSIQHLNFKINQS